MEKRLPLALFLSFLVLVGWSILFPPAERPAEELPPQRPGAEAQGPAAAAAAPAAPASAPSLADEEERTVELLVGTPGQGGSFRARFSNRGGRLESLWLGDYYENGDLDEAARTDPSNWVRVLQPAELEGEHLASLGLTTRESSRELVRGRLNDALWHMELLDRSGAVVTDATRATGVRFRYGPGTGVVFHKVIQWRPERHEFALSLGIENESAAELAGRLVQVRFTPAAVVPPAGEDGFYQEPKAAYGWTTSSGSEKADIVAFNKAKGPEREGFSGAGSGRFSYAGAYNKYFACLLRPDGDETRGTVLGAGYHGVREQPPQPLEGAAEDGGSWRYIVAELDLQLPVGAVGGPPQLYDFVLYAGPKARDQLLDAWPGFETIAQDDLGFFASIARIIQAILSFYHGLVGNYGWAIILMTLTVRGLLFPINRRSQTAMARYQTKMKRVKPKLDEIKEKYAKDPQKQRSEQARIMQEEGAMPPLGGCLPMFLQIPVFIGLFAALRSSFELRQEPFALWVNDLSKPDRLLQLDLDTHLPIIGTIEYLNLLPLLMVALWILQQRSMPTPQDEQSARMQKMMMWMPVVFGFMLYNYAAGLSLYMITSSAMGILETRVIKKVWPLDDSELPKKKKSGWMARLAEIQRQQMQAAEAQRRRGGAGSGPKGAKRGRKDEGGRKRPTAGRR